MDGFKKTACMCCWSTWSPCSAPNLESYLKWKHKTYFVGINKGSAIFLHLLKELQDETNPKRRVAFFHRNTSDERKREILEDLQLPLGSTEKQLICVVATVSLGVGVDIRVDNAVMFGLADTAENLLQEGGRAMRGGHQETSGKHGNAFFFQKGHLGRAGYQM